MIYIGFRDVCVEVLALNEAEEELVNNLDVRPSYFQDRLIFFRVESLSLWVHWGRNRTEQVLGEHLDYKWVHLLCDNLAVVCDIIEEFVERQAFDLLRLHVAACIVEVKDDVALVDLLHEELFPLVGWYFVEPWQLLQFALTLV